MKIEDYIRDHLNKSREVKKLVISSCLDQIKMAALAVVDTYYKKGGTVFLFGNGGSAADAQHIAGELLSIFRLKRIPLSAHALATDTSVLTSIANDLGYEHVFARQLEALAQPKDLIFAISTSGDSENVIRGVELAKSRGITSIGLTGKKGGKLAKIVNIAIKVPSDDVACVQEAHISIGHIICGTVEEILFGERGFEDE